MPRLWIDEEGFDIKSTRVVMKDGHAYFGEEEYVLQNAKDCNILMSVNSDGIVVQTERKNEKAK